MKIVVIGTGYVGLVSGACFAHLGNKVICIDNDRVKVETLKNGVIPIYEPGLDEIVNQSVASGNLSFSTDLAVSLQQAEAVFLAVGTPTNEKDNSADLSFLFAAIQEVVSELTHDVVVVTKSTVPVGTGRTIKALLEEKRPDLSIDVVSNPEFLREGSAVDDFLYPDRVIVGASSDHARDVMQKLYQPLAGRGVPLFFTNIPTSEMIKYASNAFLATKIAFANEMADICEGVGADIEMMIHGMGMDKRIGGRNMHPGPGFGGSCFPKDTLALAEIARKHNTPSRIVESVISSNDLRKEQMADKILSELGDNLSGKTVGILGLAFKANTDDMRASPSLIIIPRLLAKGITVKVFDPVSQTQAKKLLAEGVQYCDSADEVFVGADAVAIITEWPEFKVLNWAEKNADMENPLIIDLRNILDPVKMSGLGFDYASIGRSTHVRKSNNVKTNTATKAM